MKIYQKIYKNIINTASFKEPDEYHLALLPTKQFYKKPELIHKLWWFLISVSYSFKLSQDNHLLNVLSYFATKYKGN